MLLVDAVYVNYGGALSLLRYLVDSLQRRSIPFYLLADKRCEGLFDDMTYKSYVDASESNRRAFFLSNKVSFSSVFCFGNVPPPIKVCVPVYTYFHNINMLTLADCRDKKQLVRFRLKRSYIKSKRHNTDEWFVQTSNTANELVRHLGVSKESVKICPFYTLPEFPKGSSKRTDYIFVGEYSGSKGHDELLRAWKMLHKKGIDRTLHLTVSIGERFLGSLRQAIDEGVRIVNHGYISMEELAQLYFKSKATVYPSYNESFGLGLVEAMEAGCDVIASDRPFVHALCEPSCIFDPSSPESIVEAVIRYENNQAAKTIIKVRDCVDDLITTIMSV